MAGNGTIGLELAEDLDDFDAVLIPWGGGGLTTGIASALRALRPEVKVYVCEPESGAAVRSGRREWARACQGRLPAVVHRRRRVGLAAPEDVGARARPRHRRVRRLARRCRGGRAATARACAHRRRGRSRPARRGGDGRARRVRGESCASSRAGTSTPRGSLRFSKAAFPTSRPACARDRRGTRARGARCPHAVRTT